MKAHKDGIVYSGIWMNKQLSTNSWKAINIKDMADITAVQINGTFGKLTIFNIYNDCNNNKKWMPPSHCSKCFMTTD